MITQQADVSRVEFRAMSAEDLSTIERESERTWPPSTVHGSLMSSLVARRMLMRYLSDATRCEVATADGVLLGVTMARLLNTPALFPDARERLADTDLLLRADPSGARALDAMMQWHHAEREMERELDVAHRAPAELVLFLVFAPARGHGVGGGLFRRVRDYFANSGVRRYFLHTDSDSNVGFYDHKGLQRVTTRPGFAGTKELYVYEGETTGSSPEGTSTSR